MRIAALLAALVLPTAVLAQTCPLRPGTTGGFATMSAPGGPVAFRSALQVNMDGAPNAYHRVLGPTVRDPGLLHICNGVDVLERGPDGRMVNRYPDFSVEGSSARCKADVFALMQRGFPACDTGTCLRIYGFLAPARSCGAERGAQCGVPVMQRDAQGRETQFFVSTTSLFDQRIRDEADPRRYLDARVVPHIALPDGDTGPFARNHGVRLGDIGLMVFEGRAVFAVFGDGGPARKLGEASGAAINRLTGQPDQMNRRPDPLPNRVMTLLLPGSRRFLDQDPPRDAATIFRAGRRALDAAGGEAAFAACPGFAGPYRIAER